MGFRSTLKRLARAIPVIAANAPALKDAARQVKRAVKKKKRGERRDPPTDGPAVPEPGAGPGSG